MKIEEIGVFETKTHLSEILQRVAAGQCFYITHRGRPIAELRPVQVEKRTLTRGCAANDRYYMSPDFDEPLDELEDYR